MNFERGIDPKEAMGIGGFSYETLLPGAIIKTDRIGIAVTKNLSGQFTDWHSGIKLWPNAFILITYIKNIDKNYKDIFLRRYTWHPSTTNYTKDQIQKHVDDARLQIKNNKNIWGGTAGRMIVSKKKFDYRFKVIERGF